MDQTHAVGAAVRELTAVGVERQLPVAGDVLTAVEELPGLADAAEPQRLDPRQAVESEPVVELGDVDVGGPQRGPGPHMRRLAQHLRFVGECALVPLDSLDDLGSHRFH